MPTTTPGASMQDLLLLARDLTQRASGAVPTGRVNKNGEATLDLDIRIEDAVKDRLVACRTRYNLFSEESGLILEYPGQRPTMMLDPLDGSINFTIGKGLLPFGTLAALFRDGSFRLADIAEAGAMEHTSGLGWSCDQSSTFDLRGNKLTLAATSFSPEMPVYVDLHSESPASWNPSFTSLLAVRSTGCAAGNLTYLLAGVTPCIGGLSMKAEEVGAVHALVCRAGGEVRIHGDQGDHGSLRLDPMRRYAVLAGVPGYVDKVSELLVGASADQLW